MADTRTWLIRASFALPIALLLASCGGGGVAPADDPDGEAGPLPPTSLVYAIPTAHYRTDIAIPANVPTWSGGTPSGFAVTPDLPTGLALDPTTGMIQGTPLLPAPLAAYEVVASNEQGEASATLTIEVQWIEHKSIAPHAPLDEADLRHFLVRTHWGVTDDKLAALQTMGLPAFVDQMLAFPPVGTTPWEQTAEDDYLKHANDPPGQEGLFPTRDDLIRWWLYLMKENPNPFQEVLAFHWHDHFATSSEVLGGGRLYYMRKHVDLLRGVGIGNVRQLLLDVARDWAMLWWLDGYVSTKNAPNENFSREFLELFSLGVDQLYSQGDIEEAARAFTGYQDRSLDANTGLRHMVFVPSRHDDTDKTIFGITIPGQNATDDYEAVVDITVDNRPVAEWMVRSLLEGFCYPDPDPALVEQLAELMRNENYEIAPVLETLFLSEAFYSDRARGAFVKGPLDHAVGFMRATGLLVTVNDLRALMRLMGHIPTQPPTVNGWPGGAQWLSAQGMVDRANFLQTAISHPRSLAEQTATGLDLRALLPPGTPTSLECVDALALRLGAVLSSDDRTRLALYLDTDRQPDGSVVSSPFDPNDPAHLEERVRGLLYILGQHPTYMVR